MTEPTVEASRRPSYFDSAAARPRTGLDTAPPLPATSPGPQSLPGTPRGQVGRPLSGAWNSPGSSFRQDDEVFVLELGARYLRAGLGGEAHARARMAFGPATQTRPGDYTAWLPDDAGPRRARPSPDDVGDWGAAHELYAPDVRGADTRLLGLRVERAVRGAATQHILAIDDSKRRGVALAVQPQLAQPVLAAALESLFAHFPSPAQVAVLSTAVCAAVAAGLRSALVVDVGWRETLVSAVFEMRELAHRRSERAMRRLNWEVSRLLVERLDAQAGTETDGVTFDDGEEVIWRMCHARESPEKREGEDAARTIAVSLPSHPPNHTLPIPFADFSDPVESVFFATDGVTSSADDNLTPLPQLLYTTLQRLPPDVRGALASRILVTGGGAHIPRLKARLLSELEQIIRERGWSRVNSFGSAQKARRYREKVPVRLADGVDDHKAGTAADDKQAPTATDKQAPTANDNTESPAEEAPATTPTMTLSHPDTATPTDLPPDPSLDPPAPPTNKDLDPSSTTPASQQPPLPDEILAKLQRTAPGGAPSENGGGVRVRGLRTLGSWAGASLLAGLRQRGVVEVERDAFLAHGLGGADRLGGGGSVAEEAVQRRSREQEKRQSMIAGGRGGERQSGSWTLGAWA